MTDAERIQRQFEVYHIHWLALIPASIGDCFTERRTYRSIMRYSVRVNAGSAVGIITPN